MAAHVVTALAQVSEQVVAAIDGEGEVAWEQLEGALALVSWTADLDFEDYDELSRAVKARDPWVLYDWLAEAAVEYLARWAGLGFPKTREEWIK